MEKLSFILTIIGGAVLVFSFWGFRLIRKNAKRSAPGLSDEKYFDLKSRQDYIIATSTIVFAVLTFIGIRSVDEIKTDLNDRFIAEKNKLDSLQKAAAETNTTFMGLQIAGKDLADSMRSALDLITVLKNRVAQISQKEIIKQNLFVVDNLQINDFPISKYLGEDFHYVGFNKLKTITGQLLPEFHEPPSIIVFTTNGGVANVVDLTKDGFKIFPGIGAIVAENSPTDGSNLKFTVWISQKEVVANSK